uniref:Pyrrolo-quinoline quinone repeat domain-containing protein n=1 Tax=Alexandrium catenella TaxID=2925 RepID=A0A7S1WM13_ALECA|mmetsp:Transcript_73272/g.194697  ORF Transcript_73272/g.194697 Transcript_73272/m.194697 type:complete len:524 (+) Transcript_73272:72-1643(+)
MGRAGGRSLVLSLAAASASSLSSQKLPDGYHVVDAMGKDPMEHIRGRPEGIHVYDTKGVNAATDDLTIGIEDPGHYWPSSRGPFPSMGEIEHAAPPANLGAHLSWSWTPPSDNKFQTVIAGGPVIDHKKNIYVAATDGVRKFSKNGTVLWHKKSYGGLAHAPSLVGTMVMTSHTNGVVMGLDTETGRVIWSRRWTKESPRTGVFPAGYGDKWVFGTELGTDPRRPGGAALAWALRPRDGWLTWNFRGENAFVNFAPLFPGDDTMVIMDFTGMVYRIDLRDGEVLWKSRPKGNHRSYSEGGAVIGPNEVVYTCSNPGASYGREGELGALRAYALSNGTMLWEQILPHPCNGNPSISNLTKEKASRLSVVVAPGSNLKHTPDLHGSVMAFDAHTGSLQWRYQAPRINQPIGATNLLWEGSPQKSEYDGTCYPSHWSSPRISTDGSVWAARADGKIYNVKGPVHDAPEASIALSRESDKLDLDFQTTAGVQVHQTAVSGPSTTGAMAFSPGMTVMSTCNSLYVYEH